MVSLIDGSAAARANSALAMCGALPRPSGRPSTIVLPTLATIASAISFASAAMCALPVVRSGRAQFCFGSAEQSLAGNVIDFEADAVRIFEQYRVIAGRPEIFLRAVDDCRADGFEEFMRFVDVGAFPGTEADMMQARALLHEAFAFMLLVRRHDADGGAAADAIEIAVGVEHHAQSQKGQQLAVELARKREIADRQIDVRNAVDFHGPLAFSRRGEVCRKALTNKSARRTGIDCRSDAATHPGSCAGRGWN